MMPIPSHADAFEALCLQAAGHGRGEVLFGPSLARARKLLRPFMVGDEFPSVYLEFPLVGDPFLDVTVLYEKLRPNTRIHSPAAAGSDALLDWFAGLGHAHEGVDCGFELDTGTAVLPRAAVHFQPRDHTELVEPFCAAIGESHRAPLYLGLNERLPKSWSLSFFGLFLGRPHAPLRVCGYLGAKEAERCAQDPAHLEGVFRSVGFRAYDDEMLTRVCALMGQAPQGLDFQFDVYGDGHLGPTFAIDLMFAIAQPKDVAASFEDGPAARIMGMLEGYGAADKRWRLAGNAAFARSVDVVLRDGSTGRYAFTLMPQWVKARWHEGVQQPSKLYHFAHAGLL